MSETPVAMSELVSDICLRTVLEDGLPCPEALEELMRKLDVQLAFNRKELEKCVNDVLHETLSLPGSRTFNTAQDALQYMAENNVLEKTSCYDPDPDQVTRLLKHVLNVLEEKPGCEEAVLQSLLQLSSEEGIILPIRSSVADQQAESMISINTVMDTTEHLNESLWAEICMRLRRFYVDKLNKLPINVRRTTVSLDKHSRLEYIQSLCSLYPSEDIWNRYRSLRTQQVDKCTSNLIVPRSGTLDLEQTASNFDEFCHVAISMIDEDFIVLNSGIFKHHAEPFNAIHEIFLDKISDEVSTIVDTIYDELMGAQQSDRQSFPRISRAQNLKTTLKTGTTGSKSMDTLLVKNEEGSVDLVLPAAHVRALTKIISGCHMVDDHVQTLYTRMTWEVFGSGKKKNLKPSLKPTSVSGGSRPDTSRRRPSLRSSETTAMLPDTPPPPFQATDGDTTLRVIEKAMHEDKPCWSWREIFGKLVPDVSRAMETIIRTTGSAALEDEWNRLQTTNDIETELLCEMMIGGELDYPKCIAQSVAMVTREADMMLPLAATATDSTCRLLRTTFTECMTSQMRLFHARLSEISADVPHRFPMKCLYVALASAAFIRNHLRHYDNCIPSDEGATVFGGLERQYSELVETISRRVIDYNNSLISNCLLQDGEGHHWADTKEFYEDQRCSFSVHMWSLHIRGLRHDLWYHGPPRLAQTMLADVLKQSLLVLAQRYCQIRPSYKRTPQFRRDIISILLATYDTLLASSSQLTEFIDVAADHEPYFSIHNSCTSLLTAMTIVTSPLDLLNRIYKKGFIKKYANVNVGEASRGKNTDWLAFIHPALFKQQQSNGLDNLQTNSAISLQLNLLQSQPDPCYILLVQTLFMKDYALPILILTQPPDRLQSSTQAQHSIDDQTSCRKVCCLESDCLANWKRRVDNLYVPFLTVLMKCGHDALSKVLIPVIQKSDAWSVFDADCAPGRTCEVPPWLSAVYLILTPFVTRVLTPALRMVLREPMPHLDPLWNHLEELPCGCLPENIGEAVKPVHPVTQEQGVREVVERAMMAVVITLAEEMYCLPASVCTLFQVVQDRLEESETAHECVGLQAIANVIRLKLSDHGFIEHITGSKTTADMRQLLNMLAECLHTLLCSFNAQESKPITTPTICAQFASYHKEMLGEKISHMQEYFHRSYFSERHHSVWEHTGDYSKEFIVPAVSDLMETCKGRRSLGRIYNLLMNNMTWLLNQMDIRPPLFQPNEPLPPGKAQVCFDPIVSLAKPQEFDPVNDVHYIGAVRYDSERLVDLQIDWTSLLQSDQGLSELGFRRLLFNRHEMQEGAYLEQNEQTPVSVLKSRYGGSTDNN